MGKLEEPDILSATDRQARIDLAAAFRLAVRMDLHEGVCNHFTLMLPDGKRFLFLEAVDDNSGASASVTLLQNWRALLP